MGIGEQYHQGRKQSTERSRSSSLSIIMDIVRSGPGRVFLLYPVDDIGIHLLYLYTVTIPCFAYSLFGLYAYKLYLFCSTRNWGQPRMLITQVQGSNGCIRFLAWIRRPFT
jgi:hypothetical protein